MGSKKQRNKVKDQKTVNKPVVESVLPLSLPRNNVTLLSILLFCVVFGVFLPSIKNGFVDFDDQAYVFKNKYVLAGLTLEGLQWAFGSSSYVNTGHWHPVTWMSHMLDCELFGLQPWGHHLTSVLFHAVNAVLVFLVFRKMTGSIWRSLMVAALFGLHPLRVESVTWVSERKDVLSTFFWMLTMGAYAQWVQKSASFVGKSVLFYWLAILFFALGLMSKSMLVTLPFVLLLLDYWPLRRIQGNLKTTMLFRLAVEKIPFFVLAVASSVLAFIAQKNGGAIKDLTIVPMNLRFENTLVNYCRYLEKLLYPVELGAFYPPYIWPLWQVILAGIFLVTVSIISVVVRKKRPHLFVGWFWFIGTLVPVIGLIQVGGQSIADRYTYIPLIGMFMFFAWNNIHEWAHQWRNHIVTLYVIPIGILLVCTVLTTRQIGYWKDEKTLWRHTLAVTNDNFVARCNLVAALLENPDNFQEVVDNIKWILLIKPNDPKLHNDLGNILSKMPDRMPEAIREFEEALRINPDYATAHYNLGFILAQMPDRMPEAIREFEEALRINPDYAVAHLNLGVVLAQNPDRLPDAIKEFEEALRINPNDANIHYSLGYALAQNPDRLPEAIKEFEEAIRINPNDAKSLNNRGFLLKQLPSRLPEAINDFEAALRINPNYALAHTNLGEALEQMPKRLPDAIFHYEEALKINPDSTKAHLLLGQALAKVPTRRAEAIKHFEIVLRINPDLRMAREFLEKLRSEKR